MTNPHEVQTPETPTISIHHPGRLPLMHTESINTVNFKFTANTRVFSGMLHQKKNNTKFIRKSALVNSSNHTKPICTQSRYFTNAINASKDSVKDVSHNAGGQITTFTVTSQWVVVGIGKNSLQLRNQPFVGSVNLKPGRCTLICNLTYA